MNQSFAIVESTASNGYHVAELAGKRLKRSAPIAASERMPSNRSECETALNRHTPSTSRLQQEGFIIMTRLNNPS